MKQIKLFQDPNKKEFGSDLNLGKRKEKRPISLNTPMHLILSSEQIMNLGGFKKREHKINKLIRGFGEKFDVQIYNVAVHHSHIHILIFVRTRQSYIYFMRALNGSMIRHLKLPPKLFENSPYTKIIGWGRQFQIVYDYINKNQFEAEGKIHYFEALQKLKCQMLTC